MTNRRSATAILGAAALLTVTGAAATNGAVANDAKATTSAEPAYELLIDDGHVIDPKNGTDEVMDVAVEDGKIAAVSEQIDPAEAAQTVDASGMYVTPGLIDMHAHMFTGPNDAYAAGKLAVAPDGFTFRSGVTTAVDAGSPGWRNIDRYRAQVIDRSKTRILSFLNIVGHGMAGANYEQNLNDMRVKPTARAARENSDVIVGIKTAHFEGPEWAPVERSVKAGDIAGVPVMVDFGANLPERPIDELLTKKLRPGDVYAHMYSGLRGELTPDGKVNPGMIEGRERGVKFEVGDGGGSFAWDVAVPAMEQGFEPDIISTDLHIESMNSGMKDLSNVMSKLLTLGMPLPDVIEASTWEPAQTIGRTELGNLSEGAPADVAVFSLDEGEFGYVDSFGLRLDGDEKLTAQLTLREGEVAWDLNGIAAQEWTPDHD
ncbi:amidohydrolase/deacetylase family metallohydrolase [Solicola gregarius]|uniref:Amidohydrolase/deacetylase family metallohydrolase n=1 Tax=Solicola gregarius TaxID=2908642 RepID=A0AA46TJR7_9ACTN|nr:amidohydrolase/deacetylase family metallohydrolase [Solicola gregarius]UYM06607.1 amidohydrolase/deacetylase family metallohydrolase [Solicola gregarius]